MYGRLVPVPARLSGEGHLAELAAIDPIVRSDADMAALGPSLDMPGAHIAPLAASLPLGDPT